MLVILLEAMSVPPAALAKPPYVVTLPSGIESANSHTLLLKLPFIYINDIVSKQIEMTSNLYFIYATIF